MSASSGDLDEDRRELAREFRELVALDTLCCVFTQEMRRQAAATAKWLLTLDAAGVGRQREMFRGLAAERRSFVGVTASREELLDVLERAEQRPGTNILYLDKAHVEELCTNFGAIIEHWNDMPLHTRVAFDPGLFRVKAGYVSWRVTEEVAFMHLCAITNQVCARKKTLVMEHASNEDRVTYFALTNSGVIAAYAFVESYLNGVAHDYVSRTGGTLRDEDRDLLLDWNSEKERPRYLSLADKVNSYQRILLGVQHAPVRASNCPSLAHMLGSEKDRRDSIVHAGPRKDFRAYAPQMALLIAGTTAEELIALGDAAVQLVEALDGALGGALKRWMVLRRPVAPDGFPGVVFE